MPEDAVVEIGSGRLRGEMHDGIHTFKGIPYGGSISAGNRWRRCEPVRPWTGVRDAKAYGPRAVQLEFSTQRATSREYEDLLMSGAPPDDGWCAQSEECLTLNIWSPARAGHPRLPVMVWCHGGKYFGEVPHVWAFDGQNLARSGNVVVVTVRHRVGPFGFLHLADLPGGADYPDAGNIGLLDLVAALRWLRESITHFGGDVDNVTIFGESGGGLKVSTLLAMPEAQGLFHKAIIQSGAQLKAATREEGLRTTLALLGELGLGADGVGSLVQTSAESILAAQLRLAPRCWTPANPEGLVGFEPVVDGRALPRNPFDGSAPATCRHVPVIVGTCETETTFFLSPIPGVFELHRDRMREMVLRSAGANGELLLRTYEAARPDATPSELFFTISTDLLMRAKAVRLAELQSLQAPGSVFMYVLSLRTDILGGKYLTPHTLDVPLVFGDTEQPILGSDPARYVVSKQMMGAWAAFARTGNPSCGLLPVWPSYNAESRATMYFDRSTRVEYNPQPAERVLWSFPSAACKLSAGLMG